MNKQELSFVNVSDKPDKSWRAANKTVRAHVMRRYKLQQRTKTRKTIPEEQDLLVKSPGSTFSGITSFATGSDCTSDIYSDGSQSSPRALRKPTDTESDIISRTQSGWTSETSFLFIENDDPSCHSLMLPELSTWLDGELDPFVSLPVPATSRVLMLLQQSKQSISSAYLFS